MLNKIITFSALLIVLVYCLINLNLDTYSLEVKFEYIFLVFILGLILLIYNFNKKTLNVMSPDFIFYFLFILFHFGYTFLYYFKIVDSYDDEVFYNILTFSKANYFLICCLSSFLMGYVIFFNKTGRYNFNTKFKMIHNTSKLYFISKIFVVGSLISFWIPVISLAPAVFYDYSLINRIGELSVFGKVFWIGQIFSIFSISLYYICNFSLGNKFINGWFSFLPIVYIFGFLLIGQRAYFLYYLIVLMTAYQFLYKKINFSKIIILSTLVLFITGILSVSRLESVYNPIEAYDLYIESKQSNPIVSSISEFGSTFKTIPIIMTYIPSQNSYLYGQTLLGSLKIVIPNFGEARESNNLATWLTYTAFGDNTWGRGGSIAMEAYGNFGLIGSQFFFFIVGSIFAITYNKFYESKSIYSILLYFLLLGALCLWMRNTSTFFFRIIVWGSIAYLICIYSCRLNIWKKRI